jgi:hypothetical protein
MNSRSSRIDGTEVVDYRPFFVEERPIIDVLRAFFVYIGADHAR